MKFIISEKEKWHFDKMKQGKGTSLPAEVCFLKVEGELQGKTEIIKNLQSLRLGAIAVFPKQCKVSKNSQIWSLVESGK